MRSTQPFRPRSLTCIIASIWPLISLLFPLMRAFHLNLDAYSVAVDLLEVRWLSSEHSAKALLLHEERAGLSLPKPLKILRCHCN